MMKLEYMFYVEVLDSIKFDSSEMILQRRLLWQINNSIDDTNEFAQNDCSNAGQEDWSQRNLLLINFSVDSHPSR